MQACRNKKIVVFGGTFDPPHLAHVQLPQIVRRAINAQQVFYIPAARPPLKTNPTPTSASHRLNMLRLALAEEPHAVIRTDEIDRAGTSDEPSFTIETLRALREELGRDVQLRLMMGADQLKQFDRWRDWREIIVIAEPIVVARPPITWEKLLEILPVGFDPTVWRERIVESPWMEISSTDIRTRIANGENVQGLLPSAVAAYIQEYGLYKGTGSDG